MLNVFSDLSDSFLLTILVDDYFCRLARTCKLSNYSVIENEFDVYVHELKRNDFDRRKLSTRFMTSGFVGVKIGTYNDAFIMVHYL